MSDTKGNAGRGADVRSRGTGADPPGAFPPGPSADHPVVPVGDRWRIAGAIIGIAIAAVAVSIALAERDPGPDYRTIEPAEVTVAGGDTPSVDRVRLQIDPDDAAAGRVRVDGDDVVRVDVDGAALCGPVSGAGDVWIEVRLCGPLDRLTVVAHDIDDESVTVAVRF